MSFIKYFFFGAFLSGLAIVSFVSGGFWCLRETLAFVPQVAQPFEITITKGMQTRQIAGLLKGTNIISSAIVFSYWIRLNGADSRLRPGVYKFQGNESLDEILKILLEGREENVKFTIPEGLTLKMIAGTLEKNGICSETAFLESVSSRDLLGKVFAGWGEIPNPEGLPFPETYVFHKGVNPGEIAETMLLMTKNTVEKVCLNSRFSDLSLYQKCILASIVERECKLKEERPLVASVFLNRLKKGMKLESCATVQYALPEHKERLTYDDLKVISPFNTYQNSGLPPTPISNFGKAAVEAVASPAENDFLFFVSNASEGHRFGKTLKEHEHNKKLFFEDRNRLETH
ncbi:MAG: endolytic transglycosylase MltG [Candidatus Riflebacteria bacterium]|nr:endolytic transglycosylase MltG [Candidatus Riflebacteria bacterium]